MKLQTGLIVVPDDDAEATKLRISPGVLAALDAHTMLSTSGGTRVYIRKSMYDNMQAGIKTTGG